MIMKVNGRLFSLLLAALLALCAAGCYNAADGSSLRPEEDRSDFLVVLEEETDTVDFQCTSIHVEGGGYPDLCAGAQR